MPYRESPPPPSLSCGICHATITQRVVDVDEARQPLCPRCVRARRRAQWLSYGFLALVVTAGLWGLLVTRARDKAALVDEARRVTTRAEEQAALTRVRRLLEVGSLSEALQAARSGPQRFGASIEWMTLELDIQSRIAARELEAANGSDYRRASPRPTMSSKPTLPSTPAR